MAILTDQRIADLLSDYYPEPTELLLSQLSVYLDLLVKWNARTNLTAIRDPEEMVRRHFGESLFASGYVDGAKTLLDLGSGAGFPGIPIQLAVPGLLVTLAESQNKKASFLREVLRTLHLVATVWAQRSERLPGAQKFDVVALRAVDNPQAALIEAHMHLAPGGKILHLGGERDATAIQIPGIAGGWLQILS